MCDNEVKQEIQQEIQTPLDVILKMLQKEIGNHVLLCMEANNIQAGVMVFVLKNVLSDLYEMQAKQLAEEYTALQKSIYESKKQEE